MTVARDMMITWAKQNCKQKRILVQASTTSNLSTVTSVLPWGSDLALLEADEDEQEILNKISCMDFQENDTQELATANVEQLLGQSDPVEYDVQTFKYVHKTGKVTHWCSEYGLIDNVIYFEPNQISNNLTLNVNDEVLYSAYKVRENETERIYQVYGLKNDSLEFELQKEWNDIQKTDEILTLQRAVTGRVTRRRGREIFIEHADIWCNLDKVEAAFIPVEGDWVELQAVVTVDDEVVNLIGDIVEVHSIKPLLAKDGFGRITFWSESKKEGAIENAIYFSYLTCESGYIPKLGDDVLYEAVESDQGRFNWRAVKVLYSFYLKTRRKGDKVRNNCYPTNKGDMCELSKDISISPSMCFVELELEEIKNLLIEVTNNGTDRHLLVDTNFHERETCQLKLLDPQKVQFYINPKETVSFSFECEGKVLGLSQEIFNFRFKDFVITKIFEIKVIGTKEMEKLLSCKKRTSIKFYNYHKKPLEDDAELPILYGIKPWTPPKFALKEDRCIYRIPNKLWNIAKEDLTNAEVEKHLLDYSPCLKEELNFVNYADRFHTVLYLEEIRLRMDFEKYNMEEVCLERFNEYLVLVVPGLVEKRPSLMIGDKIVLTQPWSEREKVKHIGYIHEVHEKKVFVKFHHSFHDHYDESQCRVCFEPNTGFFQKTHEAVNRARHVLGEQWLFPSAVNEKPPQLSFQVYQDEPLPRNVASFFQQIPNEPEKESPITTKKKKQKKPMEPTKTPNQNMQRKNLPSSCDVTLVESNMRGVYHPFAGQRQKKILSWVNKQLNERQKLAVESVLKGQGRPLPYIIFGPPGTGKTVTLVEMVIQIYRLMPESRMLITTASNSAADLICERLIDLVDLKPGQLVRLVALYRAQDGLVPEKLIPYSTYHDVNEGVRKSRLKKSSKNRLQGSSAIGRHRITVATCTTVAIFHHQDIPKGHFSHILVDEAGQTSEPEVLISATFQNVPNGQLILAGDPQQLGPVICSHIAKRYGLNISLLERLCSRFPYVKDMDSFPQTSGYDPRFITKLNYNYRTVPEILSLPSKLFYNSDLLPMISQTNSREAEIIEKLNLKVGNRTTPAAILFHGVLGDNNKDEKSPSWFNPQEVWHIVFYVQKLYAIGLNSSDVGIVTPYAKQVQKVRRLMQSLEMSVPKVGSVEEFQGQERNVIILSTVRSSAKYVSADVSYSIGFVASPQRLNVALTRARAVLIIIGNPILLSKDPYWVSVVKYCLKNNSFTGCNVKDLFLDENSTDSGEKAGTESEIKACRSIEAVEGGENVGRNSFL